MEAGIRVEAGIQAAEVEGIPEVVVEDTRAEGNRVDRGAKKTSLHQRMTLSS